MVRCVNDVEIEHINLQKESITYIGFIKGKKYMTFNDYFGNLCTYDENGVETNINGSSLQEWFDYHFELVK